MDYIISFNKKYSECLTRSASDSTEESGWVLSRMNKIILQYIALIFYSLYDA